MNDRGALATMTAMANEMSLKYKHLRNSDCFANIAFFLVFYILLAIYVTGGLVGAPWN